MDDIGLSTPPSKRPGIIRSHSALPQISPPTKKATVSQAAAKKFHLPGHSRNPSHDTRSQTGDDRQIRQQDQKHRKYRHHSPKAAARHTGHVIADLAKATAGSGTSDSRKHRSGESEDHRRAAPVIEPQAAETAASTPVAVPRPIKPADVAAERRRREHRQNEIQREYSALQQLTNDATRDLDEQYYAILEKAALLRNLIAGLHDLSARSQVLQDGFQDEAHGLEEEFSSQISALAGFEQHSQRIEGLETRVKSSKDKAAALSERLVLSREALDDWGQKEKEWQAATSQRLKFGWACLGALLSLLFAVLMAKSMLASNTHTVADSTYDALTEYLQTHET